MTSDAKLDFIRADLEALAASNNKTTRKQYSYA